MYLFITEFGRPEVTLCGWWDVKIQLLNHSLTLLTVIQILDRKYVYEETLITVSLLSTVSICWIKIPPPLPPYLPTPTLQPLTSKSLTLCPIRMYWFLPVAFPSERTVLSLSTFTLLFFFFFFFTCRCCIHCGPWRLWARRQKDPWEWKTISIIMLRVKLEPVRPDHFDNSEA